MCVYENIVCSHSGVSILYGIIYSFFNTQILYPAKDFILAGFHLICWSIKVFFPFKENALKAFFLFSFVCSPIFSFLFLPKVHHFAFLLTGRRFLCWQTVKLLLSPLGMCRRYGVGVGV